MNELIDALRKHATWLVACGTDPNDGRTIESAWVRDMRDAADAIERLQTDLAKKDSQLTEWKNAWRIANSLYKSAQAEIDELRANQHELVERIETLKAEQNGEEKHEQV